VSREEGKERGGYNYFAVAVWKAPPRSRTESWGPPNGEGPPSHAEADRLIASTKSRRTKSITVVYVGLGHRFTSKNATLPPACVVVVRMNCERGSKSSRTPLLTCHTYVHVRDTRKLRETVRPTIAIFVENRTDLERSFETFRSVNPIGSREKRMTNSTRQLTNVIHGPSLLVYLKSVYKYVPGTQGQVYSCNLR